MALFSRKKNTISKAGADTAVVTVSPQNTHLPVSYTHLLRNPRITEKASMHMERSCYVFDIAPNMNKVQVKAAIQAVYKVKPRKVAIVNIKSKSVRNMRTGMSGMKGGGKKAYVYLNKGETITIA